MKLTKEEAYKAIYAFLCDYFEENKHASQIDLISDMQFLPYAELPVDESIWELWENSIQKVKNNKVSIVIPFTPERLQNYRKKFNISENEKIEKI